MDKSRNITSDLLKNAAPIFICMMVTIGFFSCLYILAFVPIPEDNRDIFNTLTGGLGVSWAKSVGFFFDSSASSKQKDETISEIAKMPITGTGMGNRQSIPAKDVSVKAEGDVTIEKGLKNV